MILLASLLCLAAVPPGTTTDTWRDAEADAPNTAPVDDPLLDVWLSTVESYRLRTTGDASDHDGLVTVDGGGRTTSGRFGADVSGALFFDIDGKSPGFGSLHDAAGHWDLLVDTLELRAALEPALTRFSIGRLTVDEGLPLTLDGGALHVTPLTSSTMALGFFGSAGRTVHFFSLDNALHEDWTAGVGADLVADQQLKIEIDWRAYVEDSARQRFSSSYGASVTGRMSDAAIGRLWMRGIDDNLSQVGARAHLAWTPSTPAAPSPWSLGIDANAVEQTALLGDVFEGESPFYAILGPSLPNARGSVDTWARADLPLLDAGLHLGAAGRRVLRGIPGPFNRDFGRVYASFDLDDVVIEGPFASVIVSYDAAVARVGQNIPPGVDPAVTALGGSAGYASELVRVSVGTSWDRARYVYYRDVDELLDVRTVSASLDVRPVHALRLRAAYSLELADRTVHTLQITLTQDIGGAL